MAKIKEITVSRSGVIPIASYENLRPSYSITVELDETDSKEQVIEEMQAFLRSIFEHESNRGKADLIDKQYSNIRFYDYNDKKYPSVTSILNWGKQWKVTEDELRQYASRGTIVGDMVEHFLSIGKWLEPEKTKSLQEDVSILLGGSLGMHWHQCSHIAFCKKFKDNIVVKAIQGTVCNEEAEYAGTYDIVGQYENKRTLFDVKCGGFDMRQLAAYAMCLEGIEQLVVLPVGPTDNKCGYKKPIICTTIQKEYEEFLKARAKFRHRFGI
jgi:hypothetical protein